MAGQTQYLEWHGQQWRVRVKVPEKLRLLVGRGKLVHPLHTSSLKEANERKWVHVTRLKAILAEFEAALTKEDPLESQAFILRLAENKEEASYELDIWARQIERKHGRSRAEFLAGIATGKLTLLDHHADAFAAHQGYRQKSAADCKRALGWLKDWLRASDSPLAVEAVSRAVAGKFIKENLTVGRSQSKAQAYLGFLRQYWKWLIDAGHVAMQENPWIGQPLPAALRRPRDAEPDGGKRPFTDDEVKTLLAGDGGPLLNDLMRVAALSGMRLEEICQLYVSDCANKAFNVWAGKTDNARRTVPIHSALAKIVERRSEGKAPGDFLFEELPPNPPSRETRSDPAAKRFTRYRRSVEVDERPNDKAKSNVEFHSFRRWFIRKVRDARLAGEQGFDEWTLTWVVGHTDSDRPKGLELSQHGYAGRDPEEAKRALVEAVKLPTS